MGDSELASSLEGHKPVPAARRLVFAIPVLLFVVLMAAVFAVPYRLGSPTLADDLTRYTVRVSLVYYAAAVCVLLARRPENVPAWQAARLFWTLGWAAYLI